MTTTESAVGLVGFYLNGAWEKPQGRATLPVTNPATGATVRRGIRSRRRKTLTAPSAAAHDAYLKWRDVPVIDRVQVLYRFKALMEEHAAEVAGNPDARKRQDR